MTILLSAFETSNIANIIPEVKAIGLTAPIAFKGSNFGDIPLGDDILAVGTPWLTVKRPKVAGFSDGQSLWPNGRATIRTIPHKWGIVWGFDVYSLYTYTPGLPDSETIIATACADLALLIQAYGFNQTANDTAELLDVAGCDDDFINISGHEFYYAQVNVQVAEFRSFAP